MNKEEILTALKDLHNELTCCKDELLASVESKKAWQCKMKEATDAFKSLPLRENSWVAEEFGKWVKR